MPQRIRGCQTLLGTPTIICFHRSWLQMISFPKENLRAKLFIYLCVTFWEITLWTSFRLMKGVMTERRKILDRETSGLQIGWKEKKMKEIHMWSVQIYSALRTVIDLQSETVSVCPVAELLILSHIRHLTQSYTLQLTSRTQITSLAS